MPFGIDSTEDVYNKLTRPIAEKLALEFATFGKGSRQRAGTSSPISEALKEGPLVFAMGVSVEAVVTIAILETLSYMNDHIGEVTARSSDSDSCGTTES